MTFSERTNFIQELEIYIQYLKANLANGWYNGQEDKNNVSSELEHITNQLKDIKKEVNN